MPRPSPRVLALITALCLTLPAPMATAKKKRPIQIVLAMVSPSASEASACQSRIASGFRRDNDTAITATSKSAIVGRLGLGSREFNAGWFDLPDKHYTDNLKNVRGIKSQTEDAVVMVSCDPKARRLRAVVVAQGKTVDRIHIEHIDLDKDVLRLVVQLLLDAAYKGFKP